jgi:hypothetical protein
MEVNDPQFLGGKDCEKNVWNLNLEQEERTGRVLSLLC